MVQRPSNVGSKKNKEKEKADETKAVEMLFEVLNGKEIDDKYGDEYDFGCGDEDNDVVSVVSSFMGDRSFDRTSTSTDNEGSTGHDDADDEQRDEVEKNETAVREFFNFDICPAQPRIRKRAGKGRKKN